MKQCPRCFQTYTDERLNFCLHDGEMLSSFIREPEARRFADDSPTVVLDEARRTNPVSWTPAAPPARWQAQAPQPVPFGTFGMLAKRDQTLPTVALVLSLISIPLLCLMGGIWLGMPAAVIGYLGKRNADKNPERYAGRGMAIGGMVLGIITFLISVIAGLAILVN